MDQDICRPVVWVLLRGLSRSAGHWGSFADQVSQATGHPSLCIDLPGNGAYARWPSPVDVAAMAEHARRQWHAHGSNARVYLLALSMGGMVAAHWARTHPEELAGVVLINCSLRGISPWYHRLRPAALPALLRLLLWPASDERWESTLFDLTCSDRSHRHEVIGKWMALRRQHPVTRQNVVRQLLAAARFWASATAPETPVLVLSGAADRLVNPECSRRIAGSWHAGLAIHPSAAHDLPLDEPEWVIEQLQAFSASCCPSCRTSAARS